MADTHFIADLHLTGDEEPARQRLLGYLKGPARQAKALYILGDLFEVWIGDDGSLAQHHQVVTALADLVQAGVPIHFMRGNRDFAVGHEFFRRTGLEELDDPVSVMLHGVPTLLAHGDVFCSDDAHHQAFRAKYTNPAWRRHRLALPLWLRRTVARRARQRSREAKQYKPHHIMDANSDTVRHMASTYAAQRIIHGHTHRPADHLEPRFTRHVLADWRCDQAEILSVNARGITRRSLDERGRFLSNSE